MDGWALFIGLASLWRYSPGMFVCVFGQSEAGPVRIRLAHDPRQLLQHMRRRHKREKLHLLRIEPAGQRTPAEILTALARLLANIPRKGSLRTGWLLEMSAALAAQRISLATGIKQEGRNIDLTPPKPKAQQPSQPEETYSTPPRV